MLFEQHEFNKGEEAEEIYKDFFYYIEDDSVKIYEDAKFGGNLPE